MATCDFTKTGTERVYLNGRGFLCIVAEVDQGYSAWANNEQGETVVQCATLYYDASDAWAAIIGELVENFR